MPGVARFSVPVQTGPKAHATFCKMGTGSFPGVSCDRDENLAPDPVPVPRCSGITLPSLRAVVTYDMVKPT